MHPRAIALICFFLSGATGLLYEVVWARLFGAVSGNTHFSITLAVSVFMGGLAVGIDLVIGWTVIFVSRGKIVGAGRNHLEYTPHWIHKINMRTEDFQTVVCTFASVVSEHVQLRDIGYDALLIGSGSPIHLDGARLQRLLENPEDPTARSRLVGVQKLLGG